MVIKNLLDYCTSFHSFKTDKKKLQVGHVQNQQAMNKPPRHTPVGTRPACPPWQGWLLPLSSTKLLGDHLPAAADHLFSRRMHRRARTRQFNSSRPSRQEALGTLGRVESPPEAQLLTEEAALCPCTGSAQLPGTCCLLPAPHSFPQQNHWHSRGTTQLSPATYPGFSCFSVQCSLPCI